MGLLDLGVGAPQHGRGGAHHERGVGAGKKNSGLVTELANELFCCPPQTWSVPQRIDLLVISAKLL